MVTYKSRNAVYVWDEKRGNDCARCHFRERPQYCTGSQEVIDCLPRGNGSWRMAMEVELARLNEEVTNA